jgi:hypothetical protein
MNVKEFPQYYHGFVIPGQSGHLMKMEE